jgi:hypothetical protein
MISAWASLKDDEARANKTRKVENLRFTVIPLAYSGYLGELLQ